MRISHLILAAALIAASGRAIAQAPPAPGTSPQQTAPTSPQRSAGCAPADRLTTAPDGSATTGRSREPLGERLAKTDGVLCPPAGVDPDMHAPAPDTGTTPVIPPPGSPGGNPTVRPK